MRIDRLRLHNFRNYEDLQISFGEGIHVLYGKNAQGKTNLLESIFYLSCIRSHRTNKDSDLIRKDCDAFFMKATIQKQRSKEELRITVNEKGKNLFIYQNPVSRVSDFIGEFNAVMFCPDDLTLFHASPGARRRFVDIELSKVSKTYVNTLYKANKLLKERNAYLKQTSVDPIYLGILTNQLIDTQVIIMKQRYFFLEKLLNISQRFYHALADDDTGIGIQYMSCVPFIDDEEELKKQLQQKYEKVMQRDIYLKQTTVGIHREDFIFHINGNEVVTFASQGQRRSILLALKVGMVYMIHEIIKEYPVLLLDDVFSELDVYRRNKLLESLPKEVQIFISTTDRLDIKDIQLKRNVTLWKVENGSISL